MKRNLAESRSLSTAHPFDWSRQILASHQRATTFAGDLPIPFMNFDRLAPCYRAMEFLAAGEKLQRCRVAFLDEIPVPRRVLLAGEGHGRFLPACVARFPEAQVTVVDSSARMLEIARRGVASSRVEFIHADLLEWDAPGNSFDLVVTNFFLDCFPPEPLAAVVSRLGKAATADAVWLLADFQVPAGRAAGLRARTILALLYAFFRISTNLSTRSLVPPDDALEKAGFTRHRQLTRDWGLLKSEWWVRRDPSLRRCRTRKCRGGQMG